MNKMESIYDMFHAVFISVVMETAQEVNKDVTKLTVGRQEHQEHFHAA